MQSVYAECKRLNAMEVAVKGALKAEAAAFKEFLERAEDADAVTLAKLAGQFDEFAGAQ